MATAAVLLLAFLAGMYFRQDALPDPLPEQLVSTTAPMDSKALIVLADSSEVWLNVGYTIRYSIAFGIANRNLQLEGEAYFKVAHGKKM